MARTYEDVMGPLRAADDEVSKAQRAVFERAYTLASEVAALREKRGFTQQQLAELAGVDQAAVSKIERGVTHPSSRTLHRVADALGADLRLVERATA
ncbi:MAG TPA: helix-turn-helix transcriptional regulator [Ilumatobacter sp.]|nr:helix-turn-helix transcriptional regulator [Ilumatobacter sp.]